MEQNYCHCNPMYMYTTSVPPTSGIGLRIVLLFGHQRRYTKHLTVASVCMCLCTLPALLAPHSLPLYPVNRSSRDGL